jgi:lipoprotein NlpI
MSGGWIANFVVGVVLLLVTPLLNGIMQHPRIAILSAASGLTIIIWVVALAMIRSLPGTPAIGTAQTVTPPQPNITPAAQDEAARQTPDVALRFPKSKQKGQLEPFPEGIFGILVLPFEGNTTAEQEQGVKIQGTITQTLSARLRELQISDAEVRAAPVSITPLPHTHADARRFGDMYHAELLIWGDITLAGVIPNLTIVHPLPTSILQSETTVLKDTLTHVQLTNIQDIRLPALTDEPTLFVAFVTGLKYYREDQYDKAIKYFTSSLPVNSTIYLDNAPIFFFRGNAFAFTKKYGDAIADSTTAIDLDPKLAQAYYNRGTAYRAQGDHARAIADFTTAIDLDPKLAQAYYSRGTAYHAQGDHARAIADFTTAIDLDPKLTHTYHYRGLAYGAQGDYARAIADYTTAIDLNPKNAQAYYNRGTVYGIQGDHARAIADFTTAIDLDPKLAHIYYNLGHCPPLCK